MDAWRASAIFSRGPGQVADADAGAHRLVKEEASTTRSPRSSESAASPAARPRSGSSRVRVVPFSGIPELRARRRARPGACAFRPRSVQPAGLWALGMMWASLDRPLGERPPRRGAEVEPVGLQRHRHQLDPDPLQDQQRAVVGRLLDDDPVTGESSCSEQHHAGLGASRWRPSPAPRRARRGARRSTRRARVPDPGPVGEGLRPSP